jgi:HSP20 family protein
MAGLIRRTPFEDLTNLWPRDFFSRDFFAKLQPDGGLAVDWSPRCDVTETDTEILVHAELPGVEQKDMEVTIKDGVLTLKGEKRTEKREDEKGRTYSERFFGSFSRALAIPTNVDETMIEATLKDGVLEVHMPKAAPVTPAATKIEIKPA